MPFRLLYVAGCVDPVLAGEQIDTEAQLDEEIVKFMKGEDYNYEEDLIFYLILDTDGKLKDVGTFSGGHMDDLRERAGV